MTAYYNEHDEFAAAWLRELIREGLIAAGDVDERDVQEVKADDLRGYTQVHLFAGIGGWSLALRLAGWTDDRPVWTGSCPCQPFSVAGKRKGQADNRHLWPEMRRLIAECEPATCFGEQVASDVGCQWLAGVFTDLEAMEYRVAGSDLCAAGIGAPHIRQRLWWVGDSIRNRLQGEQSSRTTGWTVERARTAGGSWTDGIPIKCADGISRRLKPGIIPLVDGFPGRVGRVCGYGNAIVPQIAAEFIIAYMQVCDEESSRDVERRTA